MSPIPTLCRYIDSQKTCLCISTLQWRRVNQSYNSIAEKGKGIRNIRIQGDFFERR